MREWSSFPTRCVRIQSGNLHVDGSLLLIITNSQSSLSGIRPRDSGRFIGGARSAQQALRELTVMLAGAQLGITMASLGLGAVAEPAVAHLFEDLFERLGLPGRLAHAFAVSSFLPKRNFLTAAMAPTTATTSALPNFCSSPVFTSAAPAPPATSAVRP